MSGLRVTAPAIALLLALQSAAAVPSLVDIRHAPHETYYRIVFDLSERAPVATERHLDEGYVDLRFTSEVELLAKHFQQPTSPFVTSINLLEIYPNRLTYRIAVNEVFEVHAFRQGGGNGFRFIVDFLHRSAETVAVSPPVSRTEQAVTPPVRKPVKTVEPVDVSQPVAGKKPEPEPAALQDLQQLLAIAATLEASGNPLTACRILEEELTLHADNDTLHYRLGALYLAAGIESLAMSHLEPLLMQSRYTVPVTRLLAGQEGDRQRTRGKRADLAARGDDAAGTADGPSRATHLSLIILLSLLAGAVLFGVGWLIWRRWSEHAHLAGFAQAHAEEETEATPATGAKASPATEADAPSAAEQPETAPETEAEVPPAAVDTPEPPPPAPPAEESTGYARDQEVYRLADKKKGTAEIAETLGLSQDEVRLILQLRQEESEQPVAEAAAGDNEEA